MSKAKKGSNVKVHYVGTLDDGSEFDNSYKAGSPLDFQVGDGKLLKKFDEAVIGLSVGDKKTITLAPEDAYGQPVAEAVQNIPKQAFGGELDKLQVGGSVQGQNKDGNPLVGKVESINENDVTLNLNHPLAGESLNFDIELVGIDNKK